MNELQNECVCVCVSLKIWGEFKVCVKYLNGSYHISFIYEEREKIDPTIWQDSHTKNNDVYLFSRSFC